MSTTPSPLRETSTRSRSSLHPLRAKNATIYIPTPIHPAIELYADERFGKVVRAYGDEKISEESCLAQADGIVLRVGNIKAPELALAGNLRIICRNGVGCDQIDLEGCRERGVVVTNNPGGNAMAVAELALTLSLSLLRRTKELDTRIQSSSTPIPSITAISRGLFGAKVGIIGMGSIAHAFATLLQPFQCHILIYSPSSPPTRWTADDPERGPIAHQRVDSLPDFLGQLDLLSVHCPLTRDTRDLIAEKELGMMKPSAVVINTARGGIVNERALERALREGRIAGAGLDVFEHEPVYGERLGGFRGMDNVICLPHVGGGTESVQYDSAKLAVDILADYLDGKGVRNRVV